MNDFVPKFHCSKENIIFQSPIFKGYVNFQGVTPGVICFDTDGGGWLPFCLVGGTFASCFKLLSSLATLVGEKHAALNGVGGTKFLWMRQRYFENNGAVVKTNIWILPQNSGILEDHWVDSHLCYTLGPQNHEKWRFYTPNQLVITPKKEGCGFPWYRLSLFGVYFAILYGPLLLFEV